MLRMPLVIAALSGVLAGGLAAFPAASAQARPSTAAIDSGSVPAHLASVSGELAALAAAGRRGTLTGLVDGADGRPLTGACVTAAGAAGRAMTMTRADGRYLLSGLRPGRYALQYRSCASARRSSRQAAPGLGLPSLPDAWSSARAAIIPGRVTRLPTVTLRPAGRPATAGTRSQGRRVTAAAVGTGQIRGLATGNGHPVGRICVEAFPLRSGFVPTAVTAANGHYTLRKVPAGRYQVRFAGSFGCPDPGNWLSQWYKGVTSPFPTDKAAVVRVAKGKVTSGINASLRRGGEISGTVRSTSGQPLSGICVTVTGRVAGGFTEAIPRTGKHGKYAAHGLFKGSYVVGFRIGCGRSGNYAPQWWRHAATQRAATHIRVAGTRKVTNVDGALEPGSAITGVVRAGSASGPRLRGICVDAFNSHTGISADSRTGRNGTYKLTGLAGGTYFVQYQVGCGNRGNYLEKSQSVRVGARQTRRGVNVFLLPGAGISGTVTNTHGKPVGGICVEPDSSSGFGFGIETNPDGSFSATGLNPGTYTVRFSGGCGNSGSYVPQYYNGKSTQATADPIVLSAGHITSGIDAIMQPGGTLTGVIKDAAGHRLNDVCIGVATRSELLFGDGEFADIEFAANGVYHARNLSPGAYFVNFGCGSGPFASQWFKSRRSATSADLVSVTPGQVTSGIGAVMHPAGSITGSVTSRAGDLLNRICVLAVPAGGQYPAVFGGTGPVTRNGTYHIGHLTAGRYGVQLSTCAGGRYGSQWYRAERTQGSATPVLVHNGRATPHIDATLGVGGSISGRVVSSTG